MNDEKKPLVFTDDELRRLKESSSDYDRHFIPKSEDTDSETTINDK